MENYDTIDEQIEYLRKSGQPAVGFGDGRSWEEHARERIEKIIEERKKEKINYVKSDKNKAVSKCRTGTSIQPIAWMLPFCV